LKFSSGTREPCIRLLKTKVQLPSCGWQGVKPAHRAISIAISTTFQLLQRGTASVGRSHASASASSTVQLPFHVCKGGRRCMEAAIAGRHSPKNRHSRANEEVVVKRVRIWVHRDYLHGHQMKPEAGVYLRVRRHGDLTIYLVAPVCLFRPTREKQSSILCTAKGMSFRPVPRPSPASNFPKSSRGSSFCREQQQGRHSPAPPPGTAPIATRHCRHP